MKLKIQIVTFNSSKYIEKCLEALREIKEYGFETLVIDNNSSDDTVALIKKHSNDKLKIIENKENLGFAGGHNLGLAIGEEEYILVLNPDVYLTTSYLEYLLEKLQEDRTIGMACGKLIRLNEAGEPTNILDSTGLLLKKNRRASDRGQGQVDRDQFHVPEYIFGCSGAAVIYRKAMLEDIKVADEYFDEDFFAYKEDVDLAWRAQLRGWKAYYHPKAIAYHSRGWKPSNRDSIPVFVQVHSYINRYLMLLKNDTFFEVLKALPFILAYEIPAFFYALVKRSYLLKGWRDIKRLWPKILAKRKLIQSRRKVRPEIITKWFE